MNEEALSVLEELLAQNPNYRAGDGPRTLLQVLGEITDRLLATHVEKQEYKAARLLLTRLVRQYKADNEPFVQKWRKQLTDLATERREEAKKELEDQVLDWRRNPFEPHRIANYRTVAYQKTVVMKYLDNLIAWGDNLFLQDFKFVYH